MFRESGGFRGDVEKKEVPKAIPRQLARNFVEGKMGEGREVVYQDEKMIIRRCLERDEQLPGIVGGKLFVDHRSAAPESSEPQPDQIRFEYTIPKEDDPNERLPIAAMFLSVQDPQTFHLFHRYVRSNFRNQLGLGTRLWGVAEGWLQQVANEGGRPVHVQLQAGQESVITWLKKVGFVLRPEDQAVLDELIEHPERFVHDKVFVSEESRSQGIVKDLYTFRKDVHGRYMEDAIRLTFEKKILPQGQSS